MTSEDHDEPFDDQEFLALARRVRQTADEELSEIEYETDRAELKRQDLTARSMQAMMEGERWQLSLGDRMIEGQVVHAGENFVGLEDRLGNLHDVVHDAVGFIRVTETDPRQGRAPLSLRPATLVARLRGLEQLRQVELAGRDGTWSVVGTIESVNRDHLIVVERTGETSILPLQAIAYLGRHVEHRRRQAVSDHQPPPRRDRGRPRP
jgi:ribulose 1,5-bisphosphate carboxylase large subunit-like protein